VLDREKTENQLSSTRMFSKEEFLENSIFTVKTKNPVFGNRFM